MNSAKQNTVQMILIIIITSLALIAVGAAATLLAKTQNYKYLYEKEKIERAKSEEDLTAENNKLKEQKSILIKDNEAWKVNYDGVKTASDAQKNQLLSLEKKWEQMNSNFISLEQKYDALAQELSAVQRQKDDALRQLREAVAERDDAIHLRDQSVDDRQRLQKELEDGRIHIQDMKGQIVDLAKKKSELEWVLSSLQEKMGAEILEPVFAVPKIDGSVVAVSDLSNLLMIDVGEEDGVRVGFEFTIYRGGSFIGKLVVEQVHPKDSACSLIMDMTKDKVQIGDRVSTKVF